jgi:zinc protease
MPGHAYRAAYENMSEEIAVVTEKDLQSAHKRIFSRHDLKIALVGDLSEDEAKAVLDRAFGDLPEGKDPLQIPVAELQFGPALRVVSVDTPQTLIMFGGPGLATNDPDYLAQFIATSIAASTLNQIARQERGLTYGVAYEAMEFDKASLLAGRLRTSNANAGQAMAAIKESFRLMQFPGPNQTQLDATVQYLNGKYALGFDSGIDIATTLLTDMLAGNSSNFTNMRSDLLKRVTLEDVQRVIAKYMDPNKLVVVAVGKPEGLE